MSKLIRSADPLGVLWRGRATSGFPLPTLPPGHPKFNFFPPEGRGKGGGRTKVYGPSSGLPGAEPASPWSKKSENKSLGIFLSARFDLSQGIRSEGIRPGRINSEALWLLPGLQNSKKIELRVSGLVFFDVCLRVSGQN